MNKNYDSFIKSILVTLDNLYNISFELGEEACNGISEYRQKKVGEELKKKTLEEVTKEDGSIDLDEFKKELKKNKIIDSVKDFGW